MRSLYLHVVGLLSVLLFFTAAAPAGDFFDVTAAGANGTTVNASGSSLIPLVNSVIKGDNQFAPLAGQPYVASLSYGGVPNALVFVETSPTSVTMVIPATGFTRTFTGANSSAVQDQIKSFLETNRAGAYAALTRTINQQSPVAAVDGNPQSATAFLAADAFNRWGLNSTLSQAPRAEDGGSGEIRVDANGGVLRAAGLDGNYAEISVGFDLRFTDNIALSLGTAIQYRNIDGSNTYFVGEEIGLPITIINAHEDNGFAWTVTPWGFGGLSASSDQVTGGVLVGGGGTSDLNYRYEDLTFTLADQVNYTSNVPVGFGDYHLDTFVSQWIVRNGLKLTYQPGHGPMFVEGGGSYTNILHQAPVPDYWTPEVGIGYKWSRESGIKIDANADLARKYRDYGGMITLFLGF